MTLLGMSTTGSQQMPWDGFYNLILGHAKLHDHSTASTTNTKREPTSTNVVVVAAEVVTIADSHLLYEDPVLTHVHLVLTTSSLLFWVLTWS
jgi:hypothetical protein